MTASVIEDLLAVRPHLVDLAQPYRTGMPVSPTHPRFEMVLRERHGDVERPGGLTGSHELLVMGTHVGTHVDALSHVAVDGLLHGGTRTGDAVEHGRYPHHGVDRVGLLFCRGVLFDVPRSRGATRLDPGEPVDVADLAAGPQLRPGDVALVRTGWGELWADPAAFLGDDRGVPGLTVDGARWLADQGVAAIGSDTLALEHQPPGPGLRELPVHALLIAERGLPIIECLALDELGSLLAQSEQSQFLFTGAPLNLAGATGGPIRPIAVVPR